MTRDFQIYGESLVTVKGGAHTTFKKVSELGLTSEDIRVVPRYNHRDIHCDDFGPDVPPEVMGQLAELNIRMTLIHYDQDLLNDVMREGFGGNSFANADGRMAAAPCGTMMGGNRRMFASGNHFVSLGIQSAVGQAPWRFLSCYITGPPVEIPLGTKASAVMVNWRCVPYVVPSTLITDAKELAAKMNANDPRFAGAFAALGAGGYNLVGVGEILSSGAVLWDRSVDT